MSLIKTSVKVAGLRLISVGVIPAQGTVPAFPKASTEKTVEISVDLTQTVGPYKPIYSWFGYDDGNYTTMRDGKKMLHELHGLSAVPVYIRVHHLLTSGNGIPN